MVQIRVWDTDVGVDVILCLYVWRHEKEGLGLEWELGVSPWEGRRGSLDFCALLCFKSQWCLFALKCHLLPGLQ